jgi:hypothetical protein
MNARSKLVESLTARQSNPNIKLSPDLASIKKSQLALTRYVNSSRQQFSECNNSINSQKSKTQLKQPWATSSKKEASRNSFTQRTGSFSQNNISIN